MEGHHHLRAFAYGRSDALNRARAHITDSKHARPACLQRVSALARVHTRQYESLAVQCYAGAREPIRIGVRPDEQEQMLDWMTLLLSCTTTPPD